MKAFLYTILILLGIAGVGVVTCPDREAHQSALKENFNVFLNNALSKNATEAEAAVLFASALGSVLGSLIINNLLVVENYFVCSVGSISYQGKTKIVSIGFLNHIFTSDLKLPENE